MYRAIRPLFIDLGERADRVANLCLIGMEMQRVDILGAGLEN